MSWHGQSNMSHAEKIIMLISVAETEERLWDAISSAHMYVNPNESRCTAAGLKAGRQRHHYYGEASTARKVRAENGTFRGAVCAGHRPGRCLATQANKDEDDETSSGNVERADGEFL